MLQHFHNEIDGWFTFPNLYESVVKRYPKNSHFVEIGSWLGKSSVYMAVEIINSGKDIKFDCVDTWKGSLEHTNREEIIKDCLYDNFLKNINPVSNVINPIRMLSLDASKTYDDDSLDFVFIDASHDYENVFADINAWYPKVKSGGLLAGHDYGNGWDDVVKAVDDFVLNHNIKLDICSEDCWGFFKQ